jgi:hypothetical protein
VKPEDVLLFIIEKLEKHGIDYMVTGSFASNLHGIPRATFDADIVINSDFERVKAFLKELGNNFYVDIKTVEEAFDTRGIFNILHFETGFKIDFIIKKETDYFEKEFERRKPHKFKEKICFFASPEDTILSKLWWAKKSDSERQFQDAVGVAKVQKGKLDEKYLLHFAKLLSVSSLLQKLLRELKNSG